MNLVLSEDTQRLLEERMKKGGYRTAEDAVRAGLVYLKQLEGADEFAPGEMASLLAEADAEVEKGNLFDGEEVFREIREMSEAERKKK